MSSASRKLAAAVVIVIAGCATPCLYAQTPAQGPTAIQQEPRSSLVAADRQFIESAAQDGLAEVQLGQLAAQKAESLAVKQFGQRMVADHTKANQELKSLAATKGLTLRADLSTPAERQLDKLAKLFGADFDREYMKHMLGDHKKDVGAFKAKAADAKDADLKSFVEKTLALLEEHHKLAQTIESDSRKVAGTAN